MAFDSPVKPMAMEASSSEFSYAQNSVMANQTFHAVAKPLLGKAVEQLLCNIAARRAADAQRRKHIAIADIGCSYGRNTLDWAEFVVGALQRNWAGDEEMPEIQYFFSDLPSNDFNALFQSLQPYLHQPPNGNSAVSASTAAEINLPRIYAAGVPGFFHGHLFPSASLDLVVCSYALHWLSQVPPTIIEKSSPNWNGGHTWILNASKNVLDAYALQSHNDVTNFLKSRTDELASGGIMFLYLGGFLSMWRNGVNDGRTWEIFDCAWKELVDEGFITMEEWDTFNMPMYVFNENELRNMLIGVPELKVLHMETIDKHFGKEMFSLLEECLNSMTSGIKPLLETHLGKAKSKEIINRVKIIGSKKNDPNLFLSLSSLVACLQRM